MLLSEHIFARKITSIPVSNNEKESRLVSFKLRVLIPTVSVTNLSGLSKVGLDVLLGQGIARGQLAHVDLALPCLGLFAGHFLSLDKKFLKSRYIKWNY